MEGERKWSRRGNKTESSFYPLYPLCGATRLWLGLINICITYIYILIKIFICMFIPSRLNAVFCFKAKFVFVNILFKNIYYLSVESFGGKPSYGFQLSISLYPLPCHETIFELDAFPLIKPPEVLIHKTFAPVICCFVTCLP